jgi:hypothetical protein
MTRMLAKLDGLYLGVYGGSPSEMTSEILILSMSTTIEAYNLSILKLPACD